jgi:hypothetical protein
MNEKIEVNADAVRSLADALKGERPDRTVRTNVVPRPVPDSGARRTVIVPDSGDNGHGFRPMPNAPERFLSPVWVAGADEMIPQSIAAGWHRFVNVTDLVPVVPSVNPVKLDKKNGGAGWVACDADGTVVARFDSWKESVTWRRKNHPSNGARYVIWSVEVLAGTYGVTL